MELFVRLNLDEKNLFYLAGTLQQHKYDFSSETSMKEKISKAKQPKKSKKKKIMSFNKKLKPIFDIY